MAVALLIVAAAVDGLSIAAGLVQVELLTRIRDEGEFSDLEVMLNDLMVSIVGLVQVGVLVLTVVFFCRWMLQAYRNVLGTQSARVSYTAREAVASFFIPFLNLVRPYRVIKELSEASAANNRIPDGILRTWWGLYLVMGFAGNISARLTWQAETAAEFIVSTWASVAADAVSIPAAILAAHLVRRISAGLPVTLAARLVPAVETPTNIAPILTADTRGS